MSPAVIQQVTSLFAGFKKELHVTDAGGVSNGYGPSFRAGIAVLRLRFSHAARLKVEKDRAGYIRSFFEGVALSARRVLHSGPTTIGGRAANEIEFIQGAGAIRLHQKIYALLSSDAKRMFLVYFISLKRDWSQSVPAFTLAAGSMTFSPSP